MGNGSREVPEWARSMVYCGRLLRIFHVTPLRGNDGVVVFVFDPQAKAPRVLCAAIGVSDWDSIVRHCAVWMSLIHAGGEYASLYQATVDADRAFNDADEWEEKAGRVVAELAKYGPSFYDPEIVASLGLEVMA